MSDQHQTCKWMKIDARRVFVTACEESVSVAAEDFSFKFCPYCGGTIKQEVVTKSLNSISPKQNT